MPKIAFTPTINIIQTDKKYTRMEYSYNAFSRSFILPESVKATDVKAHYEDGVLKIDVPKIEVEK
jgi:HSP20 family protein